MGKRRVGFFFLLVPFAAAPALALGLSVFRSVPLGVVAVSIAAVVAALLARRMASAVLPVWAFRLLLGLAVPAWVAVLGLGAVAYMAIALDRHLQHGSPYCWEPTTFASTKACIGRDHSLMQGRLRYSETTGVLKVDLCRALLAGSRTVACERDVHFKPSDCPAGYAEGWRCFRCERFAASGDWYRTWHFVRADCSEAVAWHGVNLDREAVQARLQGLR